MTDDEIHRIASEAADKAVKDTLMVLGVDVHNPLETQQDLAHLRRQRETSEKISFKIMATGAMFLFSSIMAAAWVALRDGLAK